MSKVIKIVLADDHKIVRNGVRSLLENEPEVKIVGEAENGTDAWNLVQKYKPTVLVTDINMPELNGIELTKKIAASKLSTQVLILSMYNEEAYIIKAVEAGVMGYLPKDADYDDIIKGIKEIAAGNLFYNAEVTRVLTESIVKAPGKRKIADELINLTSREAEVLDNIVKGNSNKIIAEVLCISTRTVDTHRTNIMKKLNARNTADLVRIAIESDLI
jgi:DNA-binding NarL/FixJ family response regulator